MNSSFSLTLPNIKLKEGYNTSEQSFECISPYVLEYIPPADAIKLMLMYNISEDEDAEGRFYLEMSDGKSGFGVYCIKIDPTQRHSYSLKTNDNTITLLCDGSFIGEITVPDDYLTARKWKNFLFGTNQEKENYLNWEMFNLDFNIFKYSSIGNTPSDDGTIILTDKSGNSSIGIAYGSDIEQYSGITFTKSGDYIKVPELALMYDKGFEIDVSLELKTVEGSYKIYDFATAYGNANVENKYNSINLGVENGVLIFSSTKKDLKEVKLYYDGILPNTQYNIKVKCDIGNDGKYNLSLYVNSEEPVNVTKVNFEPVEATVRKSNFIGKSNNQNDNYFMGTLYGFKIKLPAYDTEYYLPSTIYEFGTAYSDFDKLIKYELTTKGLNFKYPQHIKKLKHIFVKAKGGYKPNDLIFELYTDGYLTNDPKSYYCYVDEEGKVVYDYETESNLTIGERASVFDNITLGETRLGEGNYQTIKLVMPSKGKNFKMKMYGENKDYISLESFGFVSKLGKVKQN